MNDVAGIIQKKKERKKERKKEGAIIQKFNSSMAFCGFESQNVCTYYTHSTYKRKRIRYNVFGMPKSDKKDVNAFFICQALCAQHY